MNDDPYFDKSGPPRPRIDQGSVLAICATTLIIAVLGLVGFACWLNPDQAAEILGGLVGAAACVLFFVFRFVSRP